MSKSVQALTSFAEESLGRSILTFQGLLLDPASGAVKKCECLFDCSDMCEQYLRSHFDFRVNDERFLFFEMERSEEEKRSRSAPTPTPEESIHYILHIIYDISYILFDMIYIYYRLYTLFFISYIIYDIL